MVELVPAPPPKSDPKPSDLGVRTLSATVMAAVAGTALWLGGWWWAAFVGAVGLGVLWEWAQLAWKIAHSWWARALWLVGGVGYVGVAMAALIALRNSSLMTALMVMVAVIAVDVGAYFAGRTIGGPKIAPSISPSKTWAGLGGGMLFAAAISVALMPRAYHDFDPSQWGAAALFPALGGVAVAIIAQSGDFFESWMKRRAGVKDSGNLIPGHGGLFDRVDGLLAVLFVLAIFAWVF